MNDKETKEAKETLKTMKENIDKKYLKTRNSEAIETILNILENQKAEIEDAKEYADDVWRHNQELKEKLEGKECVIENQKAELDNLKTIEEENKFLRNQELGYIAGYEDGKKHKMTAVAMRIENMKYELYERHIKVLEKRIEDLLSIEEAHRKENGKLRAEIEEKDKSLKLHKKLEYQYKNDYLNVIEDLKKRDKIINLMAEWISNICFYKDDYGNSCEIIQDSCYKDSDCKQCIKQYFEKKAEEEK